VSYDVTITKAPGDNIIGKLNDMLISIPELTRDILKTAANTLIQDLQSFLVYGRGRRSGNYAESWHIKDLQDRYVVIATPYGALMIFLEFGTATHIIEPKVARVLRWVNSAGQTIFAMYVHHPGTPPIPHFVPARTMLAFKMPNIVTDAIRRYWGI